MKKLLTYGLLLVTIIGLAGLIYNKVQERSLTIDQKGSTEEKVSESALTTIETREEVTKEETSIQTTKEVSSESKRSKEEKEDPFDYLKLESVLIKDKADKTVNLSENFGRPMIINVWATWCPPCRQEMPYFQTAWEDYQTDIDFYMINATDSQPGETPEAVDAYLEELRLTLPVYFDVDFSTMMSLQATFLPTTIFINEKGEVVHHHIGLISEKQLLEQITELL